MDTKNTKVKLARWKTYGRFVCVLCALSVERAQLVAQFQMPDLKQMSGIPRPVDDLPTGAISVRLIRGDLSNNIANHPVELHVGSTVRTEKTDESGRAQFSNLTAGATVKAVAVVDGERLESQEFPAPAKGGIRLMLVATDASKGPATTPDAPPISGQVAIGDQSRIVMEPGDDVVRVFYLLDIANNARAPVNTPAPFEFDVPGEAKATAVMEGSSPNAIVTGTHAAVRGPFPPGHTFVQVAYELPASSGTINLSQKLPAVLEQLSVVVKKVGDTTLSSAQIKDQRDIPAEGEIFIAATGGAVAAGHPIELTLSGFPHHSGAPRAVALMLAVLIVIAGAWAATGSVDDPSSRAAERKRLIGRREKLFADLVRLENDHRTGKADARRYATRREEIVAALEHVYSALDSHDTGPEPAGRAGLAA